MCVLESCDLGLDPPPRLTRSVAVDKSPITVLLCHGNNDWRPHRVGVSTKGEIWPGMPRANVGPKPTRVADSCSSPSLGRIRVTLAPHQLASPQRS